MGVQRRLSVLFVACQGSEYTQATMPPGTDGKRTRDHNLVSEAQRKVGRTASPGSLTL